MAEVKGTVAVDINTRVIGGQYSFDNTHWTDFTVNPMNQFSFTAAIPSSNFNIYLKIKWQVLMNPEETTTSQYGPYPPCP
ncbi:MAG: hypothetical protein ACKV0T_26200 [Planctomycetales bacterium]